MKDGTQLHEGSANLCFALSSNQANHRQSEGKQFESWLFRRWAHATKLNHSPRYSPISRTHFEAVLQLISCVAIVFEVMQ